MICRMSIKMGHLLSETRSLGQILDSQCSWLVVLGFNATLTAKVISWRSVTHICFLAFSHQYNFSFQSHRLLFSHASAEVRGENTPERKVASTGDQTHNQQVMSPTSSPLSHPGGAHSAESPELAIVIVLCPARCETSTFYLVYALEATFSVQ